MTLNKNLLAALAVVATISGSFATDENEAFVKNPRVAAQQLQVDNVDHASNYAAKGAIIGATISGFGLFSAASYYDVMPGNVKGAMAILGVGALFGGYVGYQIGYALGSGVNYFFGANPVPQHNA